MEKRATIRNPTEGELLQLQQEVFATGKPTESNRKFTIAVVCVLLYITTSANFWQLLAWKKGQDMQTRSLQEKRTLTAEEAAKPIDLEAEAVGMDDM